MPLVLIREDGSARIDANSYCTVAEGDTYNQSVLYADAWLNASTNDKTIALVQATRLLDEMVNWMGWPITTTQALRWPRVWVWKRDRLFYEASDSLPVWLVQATAEFARNLLASDRFADSAPVGFTSVSVPGMSATVERANLPRVLPVSVQILVGPYGQVNQPGSISSARLERM